jgi:hypothetical protein
MSPLFQRRKDDKVGRKKERKVFQMGLLKNPAPCHINFFQRDDFCEQKSSVSASAVNMLTGIPLRPFS